MTKGRAKGVGGELEVAKLLERWWGQVEPGCRFVRVPMSGGWGTPTLRPDFKASGDIATNASRFPFTVEVKRREGWSWERLVACRPSPVWGWWRQAQAQAGECGLEPLLWFRRNRERARVMVRSEVGVRFPEVVAHTFAVGSLLSLDVGWTPLILSADGMLGLDPSRFLGCEDGGKV